MNKDGNPSRYRSFGRAMTVSYLDMHQSFHKSVEVENVVKAAAR
jgi:hypothetical protein